VPEVPRTAGILQPLIYFGLVVGVRVIARFMMVDVLGRTQFGGKIKPVLIYGAGEAGQQLASALRSDPATEVSGYIDDDKRLDGQKLDGIPVYWSRKLPETIAATEATEILLALPNIRRSRRRAIVKELGEHKIKVKTLPQMRDLVAGAVTVNDIRPLDIEDLLGREPVRPNELLLGRTTVGKALLVTGAGGSIGSELCRQIVRLRARKLVLFEMSEFALYAIHKELTAAAREQGASAIEIVPVIGTVTDRARLDEVFAVHAIDTVYHAAAYKHVPLVEANPIEAIRNNIIGTRTVVEAAHKARVMDFILISTDKAVRPTNVMGATKRAAEQVVQAYARLNGHTRFSMVRFGNVLGSSGSVVPLFRQQIEAGGPITLTDLRITRYFMTIPEAASLVIQAAGMARGGEVFVLDMGKPVKIADLARTMVQLSGLSVRDEKHPDGDIEIVEVGLRDGEKLYEELLIGSNPEETKHPRIRMAREDHLAWRELDERLALLGATRDPAEAVTILQQIVPEFEHRRDNQTPPAVAGKPAA
jgi:FlaA1/EpsC-like NDP-sugar epimerase